MGERGFCSRGGCVQSAVHKEHESSFQQQRGDEVARNRENGVSSASGGTWWMCLSAD